MSGSNSYSFEILVNGVKYNNPDELKKLKTDIEREISTKSSNYGENFHEIAVEVGKLNEKRIKVQNDYDQTETSINVGLRNKLIFEEKSVEIEKNFNDKAKMREGIEANINELKAKLHNENKLLAICKQEESTIYSEHGNMKQNLKDIDSEIELAKKKKENLVKTLSKIDNDISKQRNMLNSSQQYALHLRSWSSAIDCALEYKSAFGSDEKQPEKRMEEITDEQQPPVKKQKQVAAAPVVPTEEPKPASTNVETAKPSKKKTEETTAAVAAAPTQPKKKSSATSSDTAAKKDTTTPDSQPSPPISSASS